jgi:hypothetical protein
MNKPLNGKAYFSIPHWKNSSNIAVNDLVLSSSNPEEKIRPTDEVYVLEKLDGSCVGVLYQNEEVIPLIRSGYRAINSHYYQHHLFHNWVFRHYERFLEFFKSLKLQENEVAWLAGEWLAQAHGTLYGLESEPFVVFDLFTRKGTKTTRLKWKLTLEKIKAFSFITPAYFKSSPSCIATVSSASKFFGKFGFHGALEEIEGFVWRVENKKEFLYNAKYVKPGKIIGKYLFGNSEVWNENIRLYCPELKY